MDQQKQFVEVTAELTVKGKKQVCFLITAGKSAHGEKFERWVSEKEGGPLKPGFYEVKGTGAYVRQDVTPSADGRRQFVNYTLQMGYTLAFVSDRNPLEAPPAPASAGPIGVRKLA